ncbi:hypothetical protein A0H81_14626 [Grifola frondosa]|uniref:Uncharacterized protein n=1 Tax=Grifola frondosa TaxID=5627 RepID=A0A1C7LLA1_GRIFR|nr:hypothetical protein A0H81_14626 [Grifola frondosa]
MELFVDTLLREWKTFNLVSALLCTTILTIFQIQDAADDPLTRSVALVSLIFAIMSLSYGCVYIVHFGTMRSMDRASRWAEEAQRIKPQYGGTSGCSLLHPPSGLPGR